MIVIHPSSLYVHGYTIEPTDMWLRNAGWDRGKVMILGLSPDTSQEEVPDLFIQKGKSLRNACCHYKLPNVGLDASHSSLERWQQEYNLWPGLEILGPGIISTPMYQSSSNGICNAYYHAVLMTGQSWIEISCTPGRGIGSDTWGIGPIYYTEWMINPEPYSRFPVFARGYTAVDDTPYPFVTTDSYSPGYAEGAAMAHLDTSQFSEWGPAWPSGPLLPFQSIPTNWYDNLFAEDLRISGLNVSNSQFQFDWLVQHAFYDACQGIGKANENTIQNIVQIVSDVASICSSLGLGGIELADDLTKIESQRLKKKIKRSLKERKGSLYNYVKDGQIKSIYTKDLVKVADDSSSAWLGYRYSYTTSISDYRQYVNYVNHKIDTYFDFLRSSYHEVVYGQAECQVNGIAVTCICELAYRPRAYTGWDSLQRYVHDAGLELNPYVLWDFVPLSFVVDWFVPFGDVLQVLSDEKYYSQEYYDFEFVGFSINYDMGDKGHRYYRWYQNAPKLCSDYWFDRGDSKPSGKLKLKRAADTVALIVG